MGLACSMEWSLCRDLIKKVAQHRTARLVWHAVNAALLFILGSMDGALSASLPQRDLQEIVQLRAARGRTADEINPLLEQVSQAVDHGLPPGPLLNKIKEGLSKGVEPPRIEAALRDLTGRLETARDLLKELGGKPGAAGPGGGQDRALEVMAEALARNITPVEVREIERLGRQGGQPPTPEALAYGAKGLALMKEAGIDGRPLVGEALRQGFRPQDLVALGREIKSAGREFSENPARLREIQRAIESGKRLDDIIPELRSGLRLEPADRGRRSGRPERFDRPERPDRPDRPERPERPARPDRPERPRP